MKLIFITLLTCIGLSSFAQIKIKEESRPMSKGSFNALVIELPDVDRKDVEKAWQKHIKSYKGKGKYDRKSDEHVSDDCVIKDMSDNTVDVHAKVIEKGDDGVELVVWFNLGVSFLSSKDYSDRYPVAVEILNEFAVDVIIDLIEDELKEQEKILDNHEDDMKDLVKAKKKSENNIEDHKEDIKKAEEGIKEEEQNIKENIENQAKKKTEIDKQAQVVKEVEQRLRDAKSKKK